MQTDGQAHRVQERWSPERYRQYLAEQQGAGKYRNRVVEVDGHRFASQKEANRYLELQMLQRSGEIKGFGIQPSFYLSEGIRYMPDFIVCGKDGRIWLEDTKGYRTKDFNIKQKLMIEKYPWLELRII